MALDGLILLLFVLFFKLQGGLFSWGPLWEGHVKKKKKKDLIAGDHRGKKGKCKLLISLQRQFPALHPSPAYLQQSLAQGNRVLLLEGAGGLSFPDVTSVCFCESYNFLAVFKKSKYIWHFSHQLKQFLGEFGGRKRMDKVGSLLPLPWTWGYLLLD